MTQEGPDLVGQTVGEYRILSVIGSGGMGVVYEGEHPVIGKRVAVKVLRPALTSNAESLGRFLSEARAVNAIRHRGIVDIFSFGVLESGAHYFVMEYLEGEGFDRIVRARAPVDFGLALRWMSEILDALAAAHQFRIIHRDIKPSNLFLVSGRRGRTYVKLLDFGIAKAEFLIDGATPRTRESVVIGTPEYMSPEQVMGLPVSPATDLYALGAVLFELLTGQRLFRGENPMRTMWMHASEPIPSARAVNPSLPVEADELLGWMLAKKPEDRPASADLLREHVEALARDTATDPAVATLTGDEQAPTPSPSAQSQRALSTLKRASPSRSLRPSPGATPRPPSGEHPLRAATPTDPAPSGPRRRPSGERPLASVPMPTPRTRTVDGLRASDLRSARRPVLVTVGVAGALILLVSVPLWLSSLDRPSPDVDAGATTAPGAAAEGRPASRAEVTDASSAATANAREPSRADELVRDGGVTGIVGTSPQSAPEVRNDARGSGEIAPVRALGDAGSVREAGVATPRRAGRSGRGTAETEARAPSTAELLAQVGRLERRLSQHEARLGERDRLLRSFLDRARTAAESATTEAARQDAALLLEDLSSQLRP